MFFSLSLLKSFLELFIIVNVAFSQGELCRNQDGGCILPRPLINPSGEKLDKLLLEVHCSLGCIEEYGGSLSIRDEHSLWPTVDYHQLELECSVHQKIRECKQGCLQRHLDTTSTINRCRDNCFKSCQQARDCSKDTSCILQQGQDSNCQRECRKTYCRFGCEVYDTTVGLLDERYISHPPPPVVPPSIVPVTPPHQEENGRNWQYIFEMEGALAPSMENSDSSGRIMVYSIVAYVLRVATSDQEYYYWQKNQVIPLDLSSFACSNISVSFAVVSQYSLPDVQELQFSPIRALCVPGVGGYPDQLNDQTVSATYTEDVREGFLGYSVANVSWTKPNNFQFLTSYLIRVYPDSVNCGGTTDVSYTYQDIDRNLTSFILQAETNNGLWRFGCTYLIEIVSLPTEKFIGETIGKYISSTTELRDEFPPIELSCTRAWSRNGSFNISTTWEFPLPTRTSHIGRFTVALTQRLGREEGKIIQLYDLFRIPLESGNQRKFIFTTPNFLPSNDSEIIYVVEISAERNGRYLWREIPRAVSCVVPAGSLPPSIIYEVSINDVIFNRANGSLWLNASVTPPENINGILIRYEVVLLSPSDCSGCNNSIIQKFLSESPQFEIESTVEIEDAEEEILLSVRAINHHNLSSTWSQPIVILLEDEDNRALNGSLISILYGKEGERIKILEFWCESPDLLSFSSQINKGRLQIIDQKIQNITMQFEKFSQEDERISEVETRLLNIEEKLDNVIEMLNHQGT